MWGSLGVYYKNALPFKLTNMKYLQECITFEIRIGRKCYKFIVFIDPQVKPMMHNS